MANFFQTIDFSLVISIGVIDDNLYLVFVAKKEYGMISSKEGINLLYVNNAKRSVNNFLLPFNLQNQLLQYVSFIPEALVARELRVHSGMFEAIAQ